METQDNNQEEEQEESLQLPEPVAAVEVVFLISMTFPTLDNELSLHRWKPPQD